MKTSLKFAFTVFSASLLSACSSGGNSNTVDLFNETEIGLRRGERAAPAETADAKDFFELIGSRGYQTPLFRIIHSGDARIYIALPVGPESEMWKHPVTGGLSQMSEVQAGRYRVSQYTVSGVRISEYLTRVQGNYILLLAASRNADLINFRFAPDSLHKRILIYD